MPREIVTDKAYTHRPFEGMESWLTSHYDPTVYTSTRAALCEVVRCRDSEDFTYKVLSIVPCFREEMIANKTEVALTLLLGVPLRIHGEAWMKKYLDMHFCALRTRRTSEPDWCHVVHADYSRVGDFLFQATQRGQDFKMHLSVAISVIQGLKFYNANVPEVNRLSNQIFNMPQVSDTMQKYIACIILDKDYSQNELKVMVQTALQRSLKWKSDVTSSSALLVLLPMVKELLSHKGVDPLEHMEYMHTTYKQKMASYHLKVNAYDQKLAATQAVGDGSWTQVRRRPFRAKSGAQKWIGAAMLLANEFGVHGSEASSLYQSLKHVDPGSGHAMKYELPNERVPWISNTSTHLRVVKLRYGILAVGLSLNHLCSMRLSPNPLAVTASYLIELKDTIQHAILSITGDKQCGRNNLLSTHPINVHMDLKNSSCVIQQGFTEFTVPAKELIIGFKGGFLFVTPITPRQFVASTSTEICGICLCDCLPSEVKHITKCKHIYHETCLEDWVTHCETVGNTHSCPLCRGRI